MRNRFAPVALPWFVAYSRHIPVVNAHIGNDLMDFLRAGLSSVIRSGGTKLILADEDVGVTGQFIVYFDDTVTYSEAEIETKAEQVAQQTGGEILWIYKYAFAGVALRNVTRNTLMSVDSVDSVLQRSDIRSIQQDQSYTLDLLSRPDEPTLDYASQQTYESNSSHSNMTLSPWPMPTPTPPTGNNTTIPITPPNRIVPRGLDRIDQLSLPLDGSYASRWNGTGVTVFVVDTGVRLSHAEFMDGRVSCGMDFYAPPNGVDVASSCRDTVNHGTHVAGTIAGRTVGVAPGATIVSVTVFNQFGVSSDASIAAGLDYILGQRTKQPDTPMVANLSFGRFGRFARNTLVKRLIQAGVVVVVSAGNNGGHVRRKTPANTRRAITVGASDVTLARDERASWSNFGRLVDLFAPGVAIRSASSKGDRDYIAFSGTSMATPHVTGAAALYLQKDPTLTPRQVRNAILKDATCGKLSWRSNRGSPNKLLYTGRI